MNPATSQTLCQVFLCIGIVITGLAGFGSYHYGKKATAAKQQELISQNKELLQKIEVYQRDLVEKDEKIKELDKKTKMAARGITSMYGFKGERRQTVGGNINVVVGPEVEVFQQMVTLEQSRNWPELVELCEQQIKKTPDWLTPYFFRGVAYANTGKKDEAIADLRYVVDNAPGDPGYAQANKLLQQLEGTQ